MRHQLDVEEEFSNYVDGEIGFQNYKSPHFLVLNFQLVDDEFSQELLVLISLLDPLFFEKFEEDMDGHVGLRPSALPILTCLFDEESRDLRVTIYAQLSDHLHKVQNRSDLLIHHLWIVHLHYIRLDETINALRHFEK